ncbi:erythrocyte membrane protein 1 (PfEMP1), putative [Plasmodium sp. gorilla clade G1]|nr:erythrocyte membrane protein 1 (PfEMP1), putative [Plasmodium sp. gorilla clade G1]
MGNVSSSEEEAKSIVPKESYKSPRNVLEKFAESIQKQAEKDVKEHRHRLRGNLTEAEFRDAHFREGSGQKYKYSYPCYLDHRWNTNLGNKLIDERDPCYGRYKHRFHEKELSECRSVFIRSDGNNNNGTACAPPRRRHMCDKNLEALNEKNTQNIHDLLGNVLVTAKFEGDYIINNHPHKRTSDVCTALARSFADIGDIVRGRDMFKPNDKDEVWKGLREVFKKINDNLNKQGIDDYHDESGNYFKLREDWWTANRDKVWEAITCNAPYKSRYFMESKNNTQLFSNLKCGHKQGNVPTNLDYVPQYLRWYDEWAEEFCRKRKDKLKKVKEACRGKTGKIYCSHNGCDCEKTIGKIRKFFWDDKCNKCSIECGRYENWMKDQKMEFQKQEKKYESEINVYTSAIGDSNKNIFKGYNHKFYESLKDEHAETKSFLDLLKEGKYCNEQVKEKISVDFNSSVDETFSRSEYCQVCPDCGVDCKSGTCKKNDDPDGNCGNNEKYVPPRGVKPIDITILYSGNKESEITKRLSEFCDNPSKVNGKHHEIWECYIDSTKSNNNNRCIMKPNNANHMDKDKIMTFHDFVHFWVTTLLRDTISWENELNNCMNNTKLADCNNCKKNCKCFQSWIDIKGKELEKIKELFKNPKGHLKTYINKFKRPFEGYFFEVTKDMHKGEEKWNKLMENLKKEIEASNIINGTKNSQDAIKLLLHHLKETAIICKDNNTNEACDSSQKSRPNPCAKSRGNNKHTTVKQIAQYYKRKAHAQLEERGGRSNLKGDASKGTYKHGGDANYFKDKLCSIDASHSNRNQAYSHQPCHGKDGNKVRFEIGTKWQGEGKVNKTYKEVYLPPRREHMCTSNLEYLQAEDTELNGNLGVNKVNDSFLGDVLLAAKFEAERTKKEYKPLSDKQGICRAVRYSFADIGDIIRGKDMWDLNEGSQKMETILKKIFGTLHQSLPGIEEKYKNKDGKHLDLREDWWEANRHQVWKAMSCKENGINCDKGETPLDDYIPQRLRWMTEWAEWYCKVQKKEYEKLSKGFQGCIDKGNVRKNCIKNTQECKTCKEENRKYEEKIEPWKKQWRELDKKYRTLYRKAGISAFYGGPDYYTSDVQEEDKPVYNFLYELHLQNGGTRGTTSIDSMYDNAGSYVHDTGDLSDCKEQKDFCSVEKYVIKYIPPDDGHDASDSESKPKPPATSPDVDEVCKIVEGILTIDTLKEACSSKYVNGKETFPNWRCISSGSDATGARSRRSVTTTATSGLCVPPRRRKLYIHDLQSLGAEGGTTPSHDELLKWFVKSAAVETFFLWHKYKQENKPRKQGVSQVNSLGLVIQDDTSTPDPEKVLQNGVIPTDFLRQMFYTLADYRDICVGVKDDDVIKALNSSSDTKIKDISEKIDANLKKSETSIPSSPLGVKKLGQTPQEWWQKNGEHIWNGMVCTLTYKENGSNTEGGDGKTTTITQDTNLKEQLLDDSGKQPQNPKYHYVTVTLDEVDSEGAKTNNPQTKLIDFVKRPPFFRWLEEWGDSFCRERRKRLVQIKEDCKVDENGRDGKKTQRCSGYGEDCDDNLNKKYDILPSFNCQSCGEECRKYRKWIERKKIEFEEQKSAYSEQRTKCQKQSNNHDKEFCTKLTMRTDAAEFLKSLGSCSKNNNYSGHGTINFKDTNETFKHTNLCDPCSKFKINCKNGNCRSGDGDTKGKCNGSTDISANDIGKGRNSAEDIGMLVSDKSGNGFKNGLGECLLPECVDAGIFKGIKENKWKCDKVCGYNVCKPITSEGENVSGEGNGENQIILITAFVKIWVEHFLEDYNKIRKKINPCTINDQQSKCISGCKDKCKCVVQWISKKKKEWEKIKERFLNQYKRDSDDYYPVKTILEKLQDLTEFKNAIKPCKDLGQFQDSKECAVDANSKSGDNNKKDVVLCMLKKLEKEATSCPGKPSGNQTEEQCKQYTPNDYEELLEQENENQVVQPKICPPQKPETKVVDEGDCTPASSSPEEPPGPPDACEIVEEVFSKPPNEKGGIEDCNPKEKPYPGWNCKNKTKSGEEGACMPPRRQKLCVNNLKKLSDQTSPEELRKAFIECAAIETFWLWHKYKTDNNSVDADTKLNSGTIPEEFKRQMYYTFGDYRDLCLDKNIGNDVSDVESKINVVFSKDNKTVNGLTRETWWETNGPDIWKGMLCALCYDKTKKNMIENVRPQLTSTWNYNSIKDELEDFASRPPFLRWFTEWADQFCQEHKVEKAKLLDKCNNVDCSNEDEDNRKKKQACAEACKAYHEWLKDWKHQYNEQKEKFDKEKKEDKYKNTPAADYVEYVSSAYEYLHEQLEKLCINGNCSCIEKPSTQDYETDLHGQKDLPEALDNPPKEFEEKCECSEPSEPMSCVEKTAHKIRKEAQRNIETKLKGNSNRCNSNCNITKEKYEKKNGEKCKFNETFWSSIGIINNECKNTGKDRFDIGKYWDFNGKTFDGKNKLYIPPRRKHMCLKKFEDISGDLNNDSTKLLTKIQDVAKSEGDDIVHKLLSENVCNESIICDAMKYSFADLADIVRGTDIYKGPNGTNGLEQKLKTVFQSIYDKWKSMKENNQDKYPDLPSFRSAWWDANRESIWKSMTCNAPDDAKRLKKNESATITTSSRVKCGHNFDPPDYDYVPQPLRWMQEWSEYYCKARKKNEDKMEIHCSKCMKNGATCEKEEDKEKCKECNDECKKYKEFVDKWEVQFEELNHLYKELYMNAKAASRVNARREPSIKFIKKLDKVCQDLNSGEKYVDKSTHCTDYKFSETNSNGSNYAFSPYPKEYKDKCKCYEKSTRESDRILNFIKDNIFKSPKIPGLKTIEKAVPRIPKRIKNIRPDAHTIHELVARTFTYFVPFFQTDDKTPPTHNILNDVLPSAIPVGIALALTSIAFLYLKKKSKSSVDFLRVLNIPKGEYEMPSLKSKNRYIPYRSGTYKGKTYIYMEGDSGDEDKYMFLSDSTDITSSESEYEELDINDIYVPDSPKYKTLIEVVLEPSKRDIPSNDIQPTNRFTDEEWSELKHDFISQYLPNTEPNSLYVDKPEEKPFITSIHDRDLYTGEEINYNINMTNTSNNIPMSDKNDTYTGIDLINDSLSGEPIDIYDEVLKRKENELFGTKHPKRTSNNSVAKNSNSDTIMNQIDLFHTWLDRHRDMCEQWSNKEDILNKLNEEWNKDNDRGNVPIDNKTLNTNVSIQIDMDHGKPKKEFTNMDTNMDTPTMDTILDDLEKYNEPYYDVQDDIYYDVNDHDTSTVDSNNMDVPSKVQIEMDVNNKLVKEKYPIADVWDI